MATELFPTAEVKPARGLAAKLSAIMGELGKIAPSGTKRGESKKGESFEFDVWQESDIVDPVQAALIRHRLVIVPNTVQHEYQEKPGVVFARVEFSLCDGESGEMMLGAAVGCGKETGDGTGAAKAQTDATKNFLRKLFLIASERKTQSRRSQPAAAQAQQPPTAKWPRLIVSVRRAGSEKEPHYFALLEDAQGRRSEILCVKQELFKPLQESVGRGVVAEIATDHHSKYPRLVGIGAA